MSSETNPNIRVFVVWEPVLPTDLAAPSTATLRRIPDRRASQYWDKRHLISHLLGERDRRSVVWDYVAVYQPGTLWDKAPPEPLYSHAPVVRSIGGTRDAVQLALQKLAGELSRGVSYERTKCGTAARSYQAMDGRISSAKTFMVNCSITPSFPARYPVPGARKAVRVPRAGLIGSPPKMTRRPQAASTFFVLRYCPDNSQSGYQLLA